MALKKSGPASVETAVANDSSTSLTMDDPNNPNATAETKIEDGLEIEAGKEKVKEDDEQPEGEEGEDEAGAEDDAGDAEGDDDEGGGEEDSEEDGDTSSADSKPLGKFDAKDPKSVAAFDARYQKDGQFNMQALSAEFDRNIKDGTGKLDDGTYDYLASKGWPKADVQAIEAALVAQRQQFWNTAITNVGGKDLLDAAVKWGREGGYSKEQRERFNAALKSNDPDVINEALELAVTRYQKANGTKKKPFTAGDKPNRGSGAASGDIYKDRAEWQEDQRKIAEIRDAGQRQRKANEVRAKLARSKRHWKED